MVDYRNYYNNDYTDITLHYRVYRSQQDEKFTSICVQNFDYVDYVDERFPDFKHYLDEAEAERAALIMNNPDTYIPALRESHYRLYQAESSEPAVLEVGSDYEYQDYDEDKFLNEISYRTYDEADSALYWTTR